MFKCQKRPIIRQKRPITRQKRPIIRQKRPIIRQKRPANTSIPALSPTRTQFVAYLHLFFLDAWNLFDLLVVLSSVIELAIVRGIFFFYICSKDIIYDIYYLSARGVVLRHCTRYRALYWFLMNV